MHRSDIFWSHKTSLDSELQVADPLGGWDFRPYSPVLWRWLRATFQHTPFMLSSATLSTESLERIKVSLGIDREEVLVLSSSCDRPNVYQQSRRLHRRVDVWYVEYHFRKRDLHFILKEHGQGPSILFFLLADQAANMKVQIFVLRKDTADIIGNQLLIVRKLRESKPSWSVASSR